jgi:hypothetical protein
MEQRSCIARLLAVGHVLRMLMRPKPASWVPSCTYAAQPCAQTAPNSGMKLNATAYTSPGSRLPFMALAVQFGRIRPHCRVHARPLPAAACIFARLHAAFGTLAMLTEIAWFTCHFGDLHDKSLSRGETEVPHAPRQGAPGFLDGRYEPSRRSRSEALLSVAEA